jgi:hypothetical protein
MATESEELRLSVVLDDQASQGLRKLHEQLQRIGGLNALAGSERFVPKGNPARR